MSNTPPTPSPVVYNDASSPTEEIVSTMPTVAEDITPPSSPDDSSQQEDFSLPSPNHSFNAPHLLRRPIPQRWAPSEEEMRVVRNGAHCAKALLSKLVWSKNIWNTKLMAMYEGYDTLDDDNKTDLPFDPTLDPASNEKAATYINAIKGCEREIQVVKRALRCFADTFEREREFGGTDHDTSNRILKRYILKSTEDEDDDDDIEVKRHCTEDVKSFTDLESSSDSDSDCDEYAF